MGWLNEWQSYELVDFLMFSPDTYFRMVASYVGIWWPLALAYVLALGAGLHRWVRRGRDWPLWGLLSVAWLIPVPLFFLARYSLIMTAAPAFAILFALQAALMLLARAHPVKGGVAVHPVAATLGAGMIGLACLLYPLVAIAAGRDLTSFEPIPLMPDPVAALTLGWFLLVGERRLLLWCIPLLWSAISGLTLHAMAQPDHWLLPSLSVAAVMAALAHLRGARRGN